MRLFKKKEFIIQIMPEIMGSYQDLTVSIRNMPIRLEPTLPNRRLPYPGFSYDLLNEMLKDYRFIAKNVKNTLESGEKYIVKIHLKNIPEFYIEILGRVCEKEFYLDPEKEFLFNLTRAISDAFDKNDINGS